MLPSAGAGAASPPSDARPSPKSIPAIFPPSKPVAAHSAVPRTCAAGWAGPASCSSCGHTTTNSGTAWKSVGASCAICAPRWGHPSGPPTGTKPHLKCCLDASVGSWGRGALSSSIPSPKSKESWNKDWMLHCGIARQVEVVMIIPSVDRPGRKWCSFHRVVDCCGSNSA